MNDFIDMSGQSNTVCLVIFVASLLSLPFGLWWFWKKIDLNSEVINEVKGL